MLKCAITPEDITPNAHDVVLTITAYLIIEGWKEECAVKPCTTQYKL